VANWPPPESTENEVHCVSEAWLVPAMGRTVIRNEGPGSVLGAQALAAPAAVTHTAET
jgi:hypothetical protein